MACCSCLLVFQIILLGIPSSLKAGKQIREYVITFPEYDTADAQYGKQLAIATSSPKNVIVNLSYFVYFEPDLKTVLFNNSYVVNSSANAIIFFDKSDSPLWSHINLPKTATVISEDDVSVYAYDSYYIKQKWGIDAVLVRPVHLMGQHYIILIHPTNITMKTCSKFFFLATATQNSSTVNIQFPHQLSNITVVNSNDTFETSGDSVANISVMLNKHETVSCHHGEDLTGVVIRSNQPLVVTSGIILSKLLGGWEHLWTQLPPVEEWGIEFVAFPTATSASLPNIYHFIAAEDHTTVYLNCNTVFDLPLALSRTTLTLESHQFHHFLSNKPIMVLQTEQGNTPFDSCMAALTGSNYWTTTLTFAVPEREHIGNFAFKYHMIILTEKSSKDDITINGRRVNVNWNSINIVQENGSRTLVGGQLPAVKDGTYVLSSLTGTSLMTAYIMAGSKLRGICFAVGGVTVQENRLNAPDTYYKCPVNVHDNVNVTTEFLYTPTAVMTMETTFPPSRTLQTTSSKAVSVDSTTTTSSNANQFSSVKPAQHIQRCHCMKKSPVAVLQGSAEEEDQKQVMAAIVNDIQANLSVPKKNMSATVRRKTSAPDSRTSSAAIGTVAVVFLCLVLMLITSLDVIRFVH